MHFEIEKSWANVLSEELEKPYMQKLRCFLDNERSQGKSIFPPEKEVFEAFRLTPYPQVKVVIIGQDPYHGTGQAHGLCFSVRNGVKFPPSLQNIFKELKDDVGIELPENGCLESWARQGVLLLNTVLTVEEGKANSHINQGWEQFTDKVIEVLSDGKENLVFILWGNPAQKKARHVSQEKHFLIKSVHPSPLSVYRGFSGSKPFSKTNDYLVKHNLAPIDWSL